MGQNVEFMDELMDVITQSDMFEKTQMENPEILKAERQLAEALETIRGRDMSELEKILEFTRQTNISQNAKSRYSMSVPKMKALYHVALDTPMEAVYLAFTFGMASGYRAAKSEREAKR